jgi:hypothetical protein
LKKIRINTTYWEFSICQIHTLKRVLLLDQRFYQRVISQVASWLKTGRSMINLWTTVQDFHLEIYRIWSYSTFVLSNFYTRERIDVVPMLVSEGDTPSGFMVENRKVNDQSVDHSARFSSGDIPSTA